MIDNLPKDSQIRMVSDPRQMAETAAAHIQQAAISACRRTGTFSMALSGGSTPRPLHRLLCREPYTTGMPWPSVHLFWVDERMVPYDQPDSNFGTAKTDFVDQSPLPASNVHPMPVVGTRSHRIGRYDHELKTFFNHRKQSKPAFDLILLGVGTDGHVASLFSTRLNTDDNDPWVMTTNGGRPRVERLTLTFFALNSATEILFLISGVAKAPIAASLIENRSKHLPVHDIQPSSGRITYLIDQEAASGIQDLDLSDRHTERV